MFSGIVAAVGRVERIAAPAQGGLRLGFAAHADFIQQLQLGDSVMVSGVCLTIAELQDDLFVAQASAETLSCTTLSHWRKGQAVNLEPALCLGDRIGGHLVTGHVDAVGRVIARHPQAGSERFAIELPAALAPQVAHKGSIAVNGVSLTVNQVSESSFEVNIIAYTLENTNFSECVAGDAVNLEADLIARYVVRCLEYDA